MTLPAPALPIGRDAVLSAVLQRTDAGTGTVLVAPSGFGKTRMLVELDQVLTRRGRRLAHLIGTSAVAAVPFGVLLRLLEPQQARTIASADPLGRAMLIRAAVLELDLQVVLVDEITSVDHGSAAFLLELAQSGVVVIASMTEGRRVPDAIAALTRNGLVQTVGLPPLSTAECEALVRGLLTGPVDGAAVKALRDTSGGNPAVLRELVREALSSGTLARSSDLWRLTSALPAPRAYRRGVDARLDAASQPVREWIAAVAIAERIPMAVAERLATGPVADKAEQDGWTVYDAAQSAYRIPVQTLRAAILQRLGTRERRAVLRALVDAAVASGRAATAVERTAIGEWHLELGDPLPVDEALALAELTSISAPELCERFLREAVARGGGPDAEVLLAEHMKRSGRTDEAEALLVATGPRLQNPATIEQIAVLLAIVTGIGSRRSGHALAVLDAHLATHEASPDLLAVRAALLVREHRSAEALEAVVPLAAAREAGFASVFAGIHEVLLRTAQGEAARAARIVDELRPAAARTTDRIPEGPITMDWLAARVPLTVSLDVGTASAAAERNHDLMIELGLDAARPQFAHLLAVCRTLEGDPRTAVQLLQEAAAAPGIWRDSWLPVLLGALVEALALSGDLPAARRALERLHALARAPMHDTAVRFAEAQVAASGGDAARAAELARGIAGDAADHGQPVEAFDALFAALRHGDEGAAADLLALGPVPEGRARDLQRAHARAVVAGDPRALDEAARGYWAAGLRLFAISTAARDVQQHADRRDPAERAAAAERVALWSMGAPTLVLPAAAAPPRTALTARERAVIRLAASGLPDRGIAAELGISLRTAQTHLGRAFTKLGVHRRADLRPLLEPE